MKNYELKNGCLATIDSTRIGDINQRQVVVFVTSAGKETSLINHLRMGLPGFKINSSEVYNNQLKAISPSICESEFDEFLKSQTMSFEDVVKILELADPQQVYPESERIDYNGLNEGTVEYSMEQLKIAAIKCHLALTYYEKIFKEYNSVNNVDSSSKKVESIYQEKYPYQAPAPPNVKVKRTSPNAVKSPVSPLGTISYADVNDMVREAFFAPENDGPVDEDALKDIRDIEAKYIKTSANSWMLESPTVFAPSYNENNIDQTYA